MIISHINNKGELQDNDEHQRAVAELAGKFADEFYMGDWARAAGLLHDKGKEKNDFQNFIKRESGYSKDVPPYNDKTHAYVGALLARNFCPKCGNLLTNMIAGHHRGLYNYTDLENVLNRGIPPEVDKNIDKVELSLPCSVKEFLTKKNYHHLVRMLYSCLVDADYLDTERFMNADVSVLRGGKSLGELLPLLEKRLREISAAAPKTDMNRLRAKVQECCRQGSNLPKGVYSLSVPTGGGKTLSSLLWAMLHALKEGKKRVVIAIPYTTIISQTASLLRGIFGGENVLEHTCNYFPEDEDGGEGGNSIETKDSAVAKKKHLLARQNWDAPIIVTTNVQLFESMYASHPGKCRKLHNIVNSVIILDEVQTLPAERLQPIVNALKAYNELFGVSVLFTTASMPVLENNIEDENHAKFLEGFGKIVELVPAESLPRVPQRAELQFAESAWSYDEIAKKISEQKRVLCVVNTRKDASEIYRRLRDLECENVFHLSRMMCSEHIDGVLKKIKDLLKKDASTPVSIVSTQLIEAGVDIDLPFVMRQEAGLDSILQAAGRCNREGRGKERGKVVVFKIEGRKLPPGTLNFANYARLNMYGIKKDWDWFGRDAVCEYFKQYFHQIPTFDKDGLFDKGNARGMLDHKDELNFEEADDSFRLIDDDGESVLVPYGGEGAALAEKLREKNGDPSALKKLNRYIVNLHKGDFEKFEKAGMVENLGNLNLLKDPSQYSEDCGLVFENNWLDEILIC